MKERLLSLPIATTATCASVEWHNRAYQVGRLHTPWFCFGDTFGMSANIFHHVCGFEFELYNSGKSGMRNCAENDRLEISCTVLWKVYTCAPLRRSDMYSTKY